MDLGSYCDELSRAGSEAAAWVERNPEIVRNEKEGLLKDLRRAGRLFRNCAKASRRKMCAGVFGPSQAGKSYLISALARGENNTLAARFGDQTHDFLSEINPAGGKESTGLVTRFTLSSPVQPPEGYPVQARMLSETDLVKIIANSWLADCEHAEDPKSDIARTLAELKKRASPGSGAHIDIDAMEDLREYFEKEFASKARVRELEHSYWDEAIPLAQNLNLADRARLYSLIWDEEEAFTKLLHKLLQALEDMGHPETLFCEMDSLIPRETSIIDVAVLEALEDGENSAAQGNDQIVGVCAQGGKKSSLPRAVLAALTAELTIVMRDKPAEYFEHTDLLDFPGYRSRLHIFDLERTLENKGMLAGLFLRGKVAYLFQRYCAERELNNMLLCIGPSNQEVRDLPRVINDWVCATHGATPEERIGKRSSLFFILTKFDMEFEEKKGASDLKMRWDIRLDASLLDFFGKEYDWPEHWTPTEGFKNLFLLRNPNFKFKTVLEYSGDVETGIRPESRQLVDALHSAFINSPKVNAHFEDPAQAWEEAMRLNDGGISYIREKLGPLCDPEIKTNQLLHNINTCRNALERRLAAFYQNDDKEETRKQKIQLVMSLFSRLGTLEKKWHRTGELLRNFTIEDNMISDWHGEALRRYRDQAEKERIRQEMPDQVLPAGAANMEDVDLAQFNPFNAPEEAETGSDTSTPPDEAAFFASFIEGKWVAALHKLADDPDMQKYFMLPAHEFSALASELATGASRMGFRDTMASEFRKAASFSDTERSGIVGKQSAIAAAILNDYINWLGFHPQRQSDSQRTVALPGGANTVVFSPHPSVDGLPHLGETVSPYTTSWLRDWLNALAGLIMDNVNYDGKQTLNVPENMALGKILKTLARKYDMSGVQNASIPA